MKRRALLTAIGSASIAVSGCLHDESDHESDRPSSTAAANESTNSEDDLLPAAAGDRSCPVAADDDSPALTLPDSIEEADRDEIVATVREIERAHLEQTDSSRHLSSVGVAVRDVQWNDDGSVVGLHLVGGVTYRGGGDDEPEWVGHSPEKHSAYILTGDQTFRADVPEVPDPDVTVFDVESVSWVELDC